MSPAESPGHLQSSLSVCQYFSVCLYVVLTLFPRCPIPTLGLSLHPGRATALGKQSTNWATSPAPNSQQSPTLFSTDSPWNSFLYQSQQEPGGGIIRYKKYRFGSWENFGVRGLDSGGILSGNSFKGSALKLGNFIWIEVSGRSPWAARQHHGAVFLMPTDTHGWQKYSLRHEWGL